MGGPENRRNQPQRLKFTGFIRNNGREVSFNGNNWVPSENGFHREENPTERPVIYQAPRPASENGRGPKQISGSLEISTSAD